MRQFLFNTLSRLQRDEKGASLVEYGVALIVVVVVGIAAIQGLGQQTGLKIDQAVNTLSGATAGSRP